MEDRVRARCPFLPELEVPATLAPMIGVEGPAAAPAAVLREQAAAALQAAGAARTKVEALARNAASEGGEAEVERVIEAQAAWSIARNAALEAAHRAGLPEPALRDPVLPEICTLPEEVAGDLPQEAAGGLAVRVTDLASDKPLRRVQVALRFADGRVENLTTAEGGFAFMAGKATEPAVSAMLHIDGVPASEAMTFLPARSGILRFSVDLEQATRPPFTTLRLRIAGNALIPEGFAGGRYERQP